jgi:hypothetical protein
VNQYVRGIYLICYSLMMPTVLYLLLSRVLRRWLPFEDNELLLGYIVLTATLPIIGFGAMRFPIVGAGHLSHFSKNQHGWAQYVPALKSLPVLHDPDAINGLYRGGASVPWSAWIAPIAFWSAYLLALAGIWLCLAAVLRRIWIRQERLTLPITMLLRFGGSRIYRRSVPMFVGVILGDIVSQASWSFIWWILKVPIYQFVT